MCGTRAGEPVVELYPDNSSEVHLHHGGLRHVDLRERDYISISTRNKYDLNAIKVYLACCSSSDKLSTEHTTKETHAKTYSLLK